MVILNQKLYLMKKQADEGLERAQYALAQHHLRLKQYPEAVYYLQKAAKQGYALAIDQLKEVINNGMRRR